MIRKTLSIHSAIPSCLLLILLSVVSPSAAASSIWQQNGAPVSTFNTAKMYPSIAGDGSGGSFVAWEDYRNNRLDNSNSSAGDIFVQKTDVNGTAQLSSDKIVNIDNINAKRYPSIVKDGSGGAFVVWEDDRNILTTGTDIYIQRINSNGNPLWTEDKIICSTEGDQLSPQITLANDVTGDAIVVWEDHRSSNSHSQIYAQRINSSGYIVWTSAPDGVQIAPNDADQLSPAITPDNSSGTVIVWEDQRNISTITGSDIYGQRIDSSGVGLWGVNGKVVTNAIGDQWYPAVATDGNNNFVVTWEDYRVDGTYSDIYAKGIDSGGNTLFSDTAISAADEDQRFPRVAYSTGQNSFIVAWEDYRNDPVNYIADIYAQKVAYSLSNDIPVDWTTKWATNGVSVATANDTQDFVALASSDTQGVIATWEDSRINPAYDIYALYLPFPGSIIINSDDVSTTSASVTLSLLASGIGSDVTQMCISNDNADCSSWEPYSTTKAWGLSSGDGNKTVYVRFRDAAGNLSPAYFDEIVLSSFSNVSLVINGGAAYTKSSNVSLTISATNASKMCISNTTPPACTTWDTYATSKAWNLTGGDGQKTVYIQFKDQYGNTSSISSDDIILDTTAPSLSGTFGITSPVTVKDGITYANSTSVILTVPATDAGSGVSVMLLCNDRNLDFCSWSENNYASLTNWTLPSGDGPKTVYAAFRDNIGNWSNMFAPFASNTVILDTIKPSSSITTPTSGIKINGSTYIIAGNSSDTGSGVSKVEISLDNGVTWNNASGTTQWTYTWNLPANTEATYTIKTRATDVAGNIEVPGSGITVSVDTKPPVTAASPSGGNYNSAQAVMLTSNETATIYYTTDNSIPTTSSNKYTDPISITAAGTINLRYFAVDTMGNTEVVKSQTYTIDTTDPSTSANPSGGVYSGTQSVTLTCTDKTGCASTYYTTDGSDPKTSLTVQTYAGGTPINISTTTTLKFYSKDISGNNELVNTLLYTIDLTPPSSTITYPSSGARLNGTSYTITGTAADADSGVNKVEISLDNGFTWDVASGTTSWTYSWTPSSEGTYSIKTRATDNAGHTESPVTVTTVTIDKTSPDIFSTNPVNGAIDFSPSGVVTIKFTENVANTTSSIILKQGNAIIDSNVTYDDATKTATLSPKATLSEYAIYTVVITTGVRDLAGNPIASAYSFSFTTADLTKPTSTISPPANNLIGNASTYNITGTAYDSGSGVSKVELSINNGTWQTATGAISWAYLWTLPTDGNYTIKTRATDTAGNIETPGSGITVTVDNTKPVTSASPAQGTYTFAQNVTLPCSDGTGSGCAKIYYTTDGTTPTTNSPIYSSSISITKNTTLQFFAIDLAGNVESSIKTAIYTLDVTPPVTTASPAAGVYASAQSVTLTCSDGTTGSGCDKVYYTTNGSTPTTGSSVYSGPINISASTILKFLSCDLSGNCESPVSVSYMIDTTAPTGSIVINNGAAYTNSLSVVLTLSASDVGSSVVNMYLSNTGNSGSWTREPYVATKNCNQTSNCGLHTPDGIKTVYVKFEDEAGNVSLPYSASITLDTTSPLSAISGAPSSPTNSTNATLTVGGAGVVSYKYKLDSGTYSAETVVATNITLTSLSEGVHAVYVIGKDAAGNWQSEANATLASWTIDTTPPGPGVGVTPAISLDGAVLVSGQAAYSYSKVVASWTSLSDAVAGLKEYRVAIGTAAGGTDVLNWTSTGTATSYTGADISGNYFGKILYLSIKAVDQLGNESSILSSSFVYTPGDINSKAVKGDGRVDGFDLGMLGIAYNPFGPIPTGYGAADINRDGKVDNSDLFILGVNFGKVKP